MPTDEMLKSDTDMVILEALDFELSCSCINHDKSSLCGGGPAVAMMFVGCPCGQTDGLRCERFVTCTSRYQSMICSACKVSVPIDAVRFIPIGSVES